MPRAEASDFRLLSAARTATESFNILAQPLAKFSPRRVNQNQVTPQKLGPWKILAQGKSPTDRPPESRSAGDGEPGRRAVTGQRTGWQLDSSWRISRTLSQRDLHCASDSSPQLTCFCMSTWTLNTLEHTAR